MPNPDTYTKDHCLYVIETLYPEDSEKKDIRETGIRLLAEAKRRVNNWRNSDIRTLREYARLCQIEAKLRQIKSQSICHGTL